MAGEAAALLDELMGRRRNVIPGKEGHEMDWCDAEVCKSYLCGFCPCDLFTNTRADIGTCEKIHDEKLRTKYQESSRAWKMGYEMQFLSELEKIVRSLDRRITHGRERLRRSAEAKQKQMAGFHEEGGSDKLRHLNEEINSRVMQLEELGQRGEVEGAQVMLREVEALEKDRERERVGLLRDSSKTLAGFEVDANDFHEKMELCDVCGSFLVIGDSQSRVDAHLLGKQHLGYARIRAAITDLKNKLSDMRTTEIESRHQNEANGRRVSQDRRQRSRSRERRGGSHSRERRHRSRSRERRQGSRSRDRRSRSRSRNRRHSRERHRSSSRNRHSHSRRRSQREKRSHSKERRGRDKRSRSRERRSRSRGRDKRSRSRGRDKRSRSRERRSRSRGRDKRSRSRERRSHSRGRDKRSRSRERRSRSRGRDKRSRSRGREKNGANDTVTQN